MLTVKQSAKQLNLKVNSFVSPVVKVSMVIAGLNSFHKIQVKVSPSKAKSLVVLFLKNTSDQSKMVSKKLWKTVLLLVIQWLISKLSFMMVLIMKLTPQKWPSKLQVLWHSKLVQQKQIQFSSNHM